MKNLIKSGIIAAAIILLFIIFNPMSCISANERGLRYTWGAAGDEVLEPGLNYKIPIAQRIKTWSIVPKTTETLIDTKGEGTNAAISKDNQIIGVKVATLWKYDISKLPSIARDWDNQRIESSLKDYTISVIKSEIGNYAIFDLAMNQDKISDGITEGLKLRVLRAELPIIIQSAIIINFDWSAEFDKQVNATMEAAQRVRQAEQQANITEQEMRKLTIEATATANAEVAKAEGELRAADLRRQARVAEGQGIAEYNRLIAQNMQVEIQLKQLEIQLERAKRWNGIEVPTYIPLNPAGGVVTLPAPGR